MWNFSCSEACSGNPCFIFVHDCFVSIYVYLLLFWWAFIRLKCFIEGSDTDKLISLTNYCYEGSFARVNFMRLLNFSLFRSLQLKAKGGFWFPDFGMPSRLAEPQEYNVLSENVFFFFWARNDRYALRFLKNYWMLRKHFSQSLIYMSTAVFF